MTTLLGLGPKDWGDKISTQADTWSAGTCSSQDRTATILGFRLTQSHWGSSLMTSHLRDAGLGEGSASCSWVTGFAGGSWERRQC